MENKQLTAEQQKVYNAAMNGESIFLTGNAGTGKSFVLQQIMKGFDDQDKDYYVAASTGVAAVNVHGVTIHSLLHLKPSMSLFDEKAFDNAHKSLARRMFTPWGKNCLIIDEISMCRADLFDYLMKMVHYAEGVNHFRMQIIVVGDFSQLPPVSRGSEEKILRDIYHTKFAFGTTAWQECAFRTIILTQVMRQKGDQAFMTALNQIRLGDSAGVKYINQHAAKVEQKDAITLVGTNKTAEKINTEHLDKLPGVTFRFNGEVTGKFNKNAQPVNLVTDFKVGAQVMILVNGIGYYNGETGTIESIDYRDFHFSKDGLEIDKMAFYRNKQFGNLNEQYLRYRDLFKSYIKLKNANYEIALKMCKAINYLALMVNLLAIKIRRELINKYVIDGVINITPEDIGDVSVNVQTKKGSVPYPFGYHVWDMYRYRETTDEKKKKVYKKEQVGTFVQLPLRLGYAITVHKSQGQTYGACNFTPQIFEPGQLYVALSRVKSLDHLYLTSPITDWMVMVSPEVTRYYQRLTGDHQVAGFSLPAGLDTEPQEQVQPSVTPKAVPEVPFTTEVPIYVDERRKQMLEYLNQIDYDQFKIVRQILRGALQFGNPEIKK